MEAGKMKEIRQEHRPENFDAFAKGITASVPKMNFHENSFLMGAESSSDTNEFGIVSQFMQAMDNSLTAPGRTFIRQTKSLSAKFLVNMDELVNSVAGISDDRSYILKRASSPRLSYSLPLTCTSRPPEGREKCHSLSSHEDDLDSSKWMKMKPVPSLPICLKFEDVKYKVAVKGGKNSVLEKCILHGISGSVHPGEFLALMGPSGGGKTTLLNILSGRIISHIISLLYEPAIYILIFINRIGFVLQDDVAFPHLTVKETLIYAALLRLPNSLTTQQKKERAMYVISELDLDRCQDTVIGSTLVRGISGGEKKRVCIGNEILLNPSLLFLDEPTSGLDSRTALRIVQMLHHIAKAGTTVVTTIHQPSSRLFSKFDKLILLGKGNSLYFGKASEAMVYFSSVGCSPRVVMNPAEFLIDLANGNINDKSIPPELEDKFSTKKLETSNERISRVDVHEYLVEAYEERVVRPENEKLIGANFKPKIQGRLLSLEEGATWWEQFLILSRRGLKERQHEYLNCTRVTQVISTAIITGLLWWNSDASSPKRLQDQEGLLFFISVFWGFFPLFTAIFTFPQERAMLTKERSVDMYKLSAYFLARNMSDIPLDLVLPMVFMLIVYFMVGLKIDFTAFSLTVLTVFLSIFAAQGLGLAIGAAFMDVKKASTLASVALMTFMLAGGFFIQKVPPFMSWVRYISFNHYTYRLLLKIQYRCLGSATDRQICDYAFIRVLKLDSAGAQVGAMTAMGFGYRLLAYYFLKRMKSRIIT